MADCLFLIVITFLIISFIIKLIDLTGSIIAALSFFALPIIIGCIVYFGSSIIDFLFGSVAK